MGISNKYIAFKNVVSWIVWATLLFLTSVTDAQEANSVPDIISNRLENITANHTREEVYLQTSKDIYETSEDLWFKGYVLNSQFFTPSQNTKTLYVSLLQMPHKKVVWEEKYAVKNGFTDGHIYIQDTLQPGEYALVAQTGFSVNADDNEIKSVKKIVIIKSIDALKEKSQAETAAVQTDSIDFQFMPEGGHLVAGITSKVAFKSVDNKGNPVEVKGVIYNGTKAMFSIASYHGGMGSFYIIPLADDAYSVKLEGYNTNYPLPKVAATGYVLQLLSKNADTLNLRVAKSKALPEQKMYVRLQLRGTVYNTAQFTINGEKRIKMPVGDIPSGIAEVTLFDSEFKPVAERLIFINEDKKLNITATLDKIEYGTKDKVKLKFTAVDDKGGPIVAHFGVSISDDVYLDPKNSETIESYYQLSTQVKGKICNPGYYFNPQNKNRQPALDLLLLTQGWRSYQWAEDNLARQASKKQPFVSDTLTGIILAKKPKARDKLHQQIVMNYFGFEELNKTLLEVDSKGKYTIFPENLQFDKREYAYFKLLQSSSDIAIQRIVDPATEKIRKITAKKQFVYPLPGNQKKAPVPPERFKVAKNVNQLNEVVLTARVKKKRAFRDKYLGKLDSLSNNVDYVCEFGVLNCPRHPFNGLRPVEGQVYKDPDTNVFLAPYRFHHYTEDELLAKFNMTRIKSYYPAKEFYSPVYDAETIDNTNDFRNTLYWNPNLITDASGVAEIEFYTSDITSKYKIMIEGVSGDGLLGSQALEFKVVKKEVK
ncbi:hypothetical protein Q765_20615 [Flavobacterium rivuli WB 3.3-2 = DSM 21788]|uniref:Macroglobulin domain-containing protein n=1 Tax=Flavobacterium rivuli WB 3.3-2 = DSM 21788 TaxID=1121895 RepID=A0A0A2LXB5_9FLAO|nr:hypothetical protein [Flavobacterium rivuli]KGO84624.1 hypothetical protein Q765_20615 [Flavobacterium rivuli WB 3.3-2 = DSM 21788]